MSRTRQVAEDAAVAGPSSSTDQRVPGLAKLDQYPQNYATASSGGTLTHAHTSQPSNTENPDGSLYSYNSSRDISQFVRDCFGRTFNNLNEAYLLPTDDVEWGRLDKQHTALRIGFGGLYPCPEIIDRVLAPVEGEEKRVLDVGCGTGTWAIEMANRFPYVGVLGIDLAPTPLDSSAFPPNLSFEIDDINLGLHHFYNQFDLIHMRCVVGGVTNIDKTLKELAQCLKPGGVLLCIGGDLELWDENKSKVKTAKQPGEPDLDGLSANGSWLQRMIWEACEACNIAGSCLDRSLGVLEAGLWNHELCDPETALSGGVYLPLGPWAVGQTLDETHMLQYVGVLIRQVFMNIHRAYHSILLKHGMSREKLEEWSQNADEELNSIRFKMWVRFRFCMARKRAGPGLPAPPLPDLPTTTRSSSSSGAAGVDDEDDRPPTRPLYRALDIFRNRDDAIADTRKRQATVGRLPESAVRRAWREQIQL